MSRRRKWIEIREEFRAVVYRDGAETVARRMPVHRSTVYRLINGQIQRPSGLMRAAVEREVADATSSPVTVEPPRESPQLRPLPPIPPRVRKP